MNQQMVIDELERKLKQHTVEDAEEIMTVMEAFQETFKLSLVFGFKLKNIKKALRFFTKIDMLLER